MINRRKLTAGNWKMNLTIEQSLSLVKEIGRGLSKNNFEIEILIAPSYLSIFPIIELLKKNNWQKIIKIAAQDVYYEEDGAFTGKVSASMLKNLGLEYCIIGHSEQRTLFGETNKTVNLKTKKLLDNHISPIVCVGETLLERKNNLLEKILAEQITVALNEVKEDQASTIIIAYEPVWAIGTGVSASSDEAQNAHKFIRKILLGLYPNLANLIPILYGGSVNPKNANSFFTCPDIDGALIGGASLKSIDFLTIHKSWSN